MSTVVVLQGSLKTQVNYEMSYVHSSMIQVVRMCAVWWRLPWTLIITARKVSAGSMVVDLDYMGSKSTAINTVETFRVGKHQGL